jgi:hypothetical protein
MKHGASKLPEKKFRPLYQKTHGTVRAVALMLRMDGNNRKEKNRGKTKAKA